MRRFLWVMVVLACLMPVLSLGSAQAAEALTQGPGILLAEADHAAWRVPAGETRHDESHQHHEGTDHDPANCLKWAARGAEIVVGRPSPEFGDLPALSGAIREGPRRPPREAV